jgi:hypothetical protein
VLVAIEVVSPGSRRMDTVTKRSEYVEAEIEHYWIVELWPAGHAHRVAPRRGVRLSRITSRHRHIYDECSGAITSRPRRTKGAVASPRSSEQSANVVAVRAKRTVLPPSMTLGKSLAFLRWCRDKPVNQGIGCMAAGVGAIDGLGFGGGVRPAARFFV